MIQSLMDYYGYFTTFNFLVVEVQLIATLIGFEAIFFIFWFNHKYNTATKNKTKKISKEEKFKLSIITTIFIGIMLVGMMILIGNMNVLFNVPVSLENFSAQSENIIEIPIHIVDNLDFVHTLFTLWTLSSFIYIVALILSLDIFEFEITEVEKKPRKRTEIKLGKKIKKFFGGK